MSTNRLTLLAWPLERNFKAATTDTTVAKQFCPVIMLLSEINSYGIAVKNSGEQSPGTPAMIIYESTRFSWKRSMSLYSTALLFWTVFCFFIQIFNTLFGIPFPIDLVTITAPNNNTEETTVLMNINRVATIFISLCRIFEFVGLYLSAPHLAEWLNKLTAIETEFNANFSRVGFRSTVDVTRLRNLLLTFYLALPGALWMAGNYWTFWPQYNFNPKYIALGNIWYFSYVLFLQVSQLLEDVKIILMLEILRRSYSQMRSAIGQEICREVIKVKNVINWDALIKKHRRHVKLTGECIKTQLMLNICETVFVVSVGIYLVIRSAGGDSGTNLRFSINSGVYCAFIIGRLYMKVAIAESIYAEEQLLLQDLKDSDERVRTDSTAALHELRTLQQTLALVPSKLYIGSYFELDGKLMVQVAIQTIAMVITVAQFYT